MKKYKISILLPIKDLNVESYKKCINSILSQSYDNFEVIIKYNGSYDEFKFIQSLLLDDRFIFINQKDKSVANAANQAMIYTNGDLITLFCHDDEYLQDAFKTIIESIDDHKWYFGFIRYFVDGIEVPTYYKSDPNLLDMMRDNLIPQPACFFKKEIYNEIGQFDDKFLLCWDYDYWIRIMKKYQPKTIYNYIAKYYLNNNSISIKHKDKMETEKQLVLEKHF